MSYSTRIYQAIEEIRETDWQKISLEGGLYYSYYWLRSVQGQLTPHTFYITVWADEQLVAGMPCYLIDNPKTYTFFNIPRLLTDETILQEISPFLEKEEREQLQQKTAILRPQQNRLYPTLISTAPYGYTSTLCCRQDLDKETTQVTDMLLDAFEQITAENNVSSSAFLYVPQHHNLLPAKLIGRRYMPSLLGAESILPITWNSFDDYLLSRRKKRRESIRRERRVFQKNGFTTQIGDASSLDDTIVRLQSNLQKKYGHSGDPERLKQGFEQIKTHLAPFVRVYLAQKNEQVVGYALFYEMNKTYYCKQVGFDYARLGNNFCYFNIGFYEPIIQAIKSGIISIHYGAGAYEAKLGRGCKLNHLLGFFKCSPAADDLKSDIAAILELERIGRTAQFDAMSSSEITV